MYILNGQRVVIYTSLHYTIHPNFYVTLVIFNTI